MTSGVALIDKPQGWTSHDVVAKLRGIAGTRRVGHAGTLDPMATGLLLIGINSGTKLLTYLVGADKTYEARIRLGEATVTDDAEGKITSTANASGLSQKQIEEAIANLRGEIMQVPSSVSAIKVDGKRAYAKVRGGEEVKLQARPVTISNFEITSTPESVGTCIEFDATITCSSGTYIRALARDLGNALGVGGHLVQLRRTRVGNFHVQDAQKMEGLAELKVASMTDVARASFVTLALDEQQAVDLRHGKRISGEAGGAKVIAGIRGDQLVAMLEPVGEQLKSTVVFVEK